MAAGRIQPALDLAEQALARPELVSPVDRLNLRVLQATLSNAQPARQQALEELADLLSNDARLLHSVAESALANRRFDQAVRLFQRAVEIDPEDATAFNLLGYSYLYAGKLKESRESFDRYANQPVHRANALDSQGEVLFMAGQFAEAERYFLQAHEEDAELLAGGDLMKAAYARWLAGDRNEADTIFDSYMKYRSQKTDNTMFWRMAAWLFATGREQEATSLLEAEQGPAALLARQQLEAWRHPERLPDQLNELEQVYVRTNPTADGLVRVLYARALLDAGRTEEAKRLLVLYPLPESGDRLLQSFIYPIFRELKTRTQ
jgi:Flp pilus assembly protein TadD